jgi:two-component system, NtrC family, nitrogen regulation response regulator GlnG
MFTVAILEDVEADRRHLSAALPRAEFRSSGFGDAGTFLEQIEELDPDAVLLDLDLSATNGLEVLRELRGRLPLHVPVIVIAAESDGSTAREALEAGAVAALEKPVDRAALLELLRTALGGDAP